MNSLATKILPRLFVLAIIAFLLNWIYSVAFYPSDLKKIDLIDSLQKVIPRSDVIYFGESSNFSFVFEDDDQRRISDFISDYYPGLQFGTVNKGALHAGIYLKLLKQIPTEAPVNTIILSMNLRSFSADWIYSKLESLLQRDMVLISDGPPLWNRFRLGLKAYDNKTQKQRSMQVKNALKKDLLFLEPPCDFPNAVAWIENINNSPTSPWIEDSLAKSLAISFIINYGFRIDTVNNPRIRDFDKIIEYARQRGWKVVLNILPENTQQASLLIGPCLRKLMISNAKLLTKRYESQGAIVVNNLELVDSSHYIDKKWPTEHYDEYGRKMVAPQIALAMRNIYPAHFSDVFMKSDFTCDFEAPSPFFVTLGRDSTCSHSGKFAEKLDTNNAFGARFVRHYFEVKTLNPRKITASGWFTGIYRPREVKLIISIENDKKQPKLWTATVSKDIIEYGKWDSLQVNANIPENFGDNDVIRIYFWYTGKNKVWIDDVNILLQTENLNAASDTILLIKN